MKHRRDGFTRPCSAWDIYIDGMGLSCANCGAYDGPPRPVDVLQESIDKASTHLRLVQGEIHAEWPMEGEKRVEFYRRQVAAAIQELQKFIDLLP